MLSPVLISLVTLSVTCWTLPIHAEITFDKYETFKNDEQFGVYLDGVSAGFAQANVDLYLSDQPRLYCSPPKLGLNRKNLLQILESYIAKPNVQAALSRLPDTYVELMLLRALKNVFPCK